MRTIIALFIVSLFSTVSFSQDLTGVWEGNGGVTSYAKICIIRWNNTYIGYTYDEGMGYCKANFLGQFDSVKKKLKGTNKGFIEKTIFHFQSKYNLNYLLIHGQEYLKGIATAKTVGAKVLSVGMPIFVTYTRTNKYIDTTEFMQKWLAADPLLVNKNLNIEDNNEKNTEDVTTITPTQPSITETITMQKNARRNDTVSVITIHDKQLKLTILDNGIADNDTISIFHNNKLLLGKEEVSVKGLTLTITISDTDPYHEIVLVAHNVGSIPPNTALVIIDTGNEKYRLTASSDLTKNAMIIFKYKEY